MVCYLLLLDFFLLHETCADFIPSVVIVNPADGPIHLPHPGVPTATGRGVRVLQEEAGEYAKKIPLSIRHRPSAMSSFKRHSASFLCVVSGVMLSSSSDLRVKF